MLHKPTTYKMGPTEKEIFQLQSNMYDLQVKIAKCMELLNKEGVRQGLITLKMINDEYKKITQSDYVKKEYFDKQYERLQKGCI